MRISKELLEIIINEKIEDYLYMGNIIEIYTKNKEKYNINLYELANKCKEWSITQGYSVSSKVTIKGGNRGVKTKAVSTVRLISNTAIYKIFNNNIEYESIFSSCEWILKEGN